MSDNMKNDKGVPAWINFTFLAVAILGVLYAVFSIGFAANDPLTIYRKSTGKLFAQADVVKIPERTPETIAKGEQVYAQVCSACHGANMEGVVGPSLVDAAWWHPPETEANMFQLVKNGIPAAIAVGKNGPMLPKGGSSINDEQIWEAIYYVSSKNTRIKRSEE